MDPHVEVIHQDGTAEVFRIEGKHAVLGKSPAATIPVPDVRELAAEHLTLTPQSDGCRVTELPGGALQGYRGGPGGRDAVVPWGGEIAVGPLRLVMHRSAPRSTGGSRMSRILLVSVLLVGALWVVALTSRSSVDVRTDSGVPAPELFDAGAASCPVDAARATARAEQTLIAADAKNERYAFDAQDGIEAVTLYQTAAACFLSAGEDERGIAAGQKGVRLRQRIEGDYRAHRLRLERALVQERYTDALSEVRSLSPLLRHRHDDYTAWLTIVERQLMLALEERS